MLATYSETTVLCYSCVKPSWIEEEKILDIFEVFYPKYKATKFTLQKEKKSFDITDLLILII